jgi:hypothetical protein
MLLARKSRSVVALLTAVLLLLCQTAFAAQACAHQSARAEATAASPPCHEVAESHGSTAPHAPASVASCDLAKASADPAKVQVYAVTDLPPVLTTKDQVVLGVSSPAQQVVHALCYSPPLSILHCRFLN